MRPNISSALARVALTTLAAGLLIAVWPSPAAAQNDLYAPATAKRCARWAAALSETRGRALAVLRAQRLESCPSAGPRALAAAIERAGSETDTAYLAALADDAGIVTHPAIFAAALRLSRDRAATVGARVAGMLVLAGQSGGGLRVNGSGVRDLLTEGLPVSGVCLTSLRVIEGGPPRATAALPADAPRQAAVVVDRIRTDTTEPVLLRTLARCVRSVVARGVPPQVDVSGVRLMYDCGDWFRILNATSEPLMFAFAAEKTGERHNIIVSPGGERQFGIAAPSTVRLYYDGRLIQTAAHGGTACPR